MKTFWQIIDLCDVLLQISALEAQKWLIKSTFDAIIQVKGTYMKTEASTLQTAQKRVGSTCRHAVHYVCRLYSKVQQKFYRWVFYDLPAFSIFHDCIHCFKNAKRLFHSYKIIGSTSLLQPIAKDCDS